MARLQEFYRETVVPKLIEQFGYKSVMEVPRIQKITLNMGVGEAVADKKVMDHAVSDMQKIAGQKPVVTKSKKSIAGFKIRENYPVGCMVTLRRARMYEFLDRLVTVAMPRIRDFRGVSGKSFDGRGNYNMGVKEQIAHGIQLIIHLVLFVPVVLLTALVITALFAMPELIRMVAARDYPELERKKGGGLVGSLWNAVIALVLFAALWVVTLPLWLIGIGVLVPFVAAAWLNQRLFRYDAVAEHASAAEMAALFRNERSNWWGLGVLTGLVQFVPLLNLFGPVFAALAFIHFGLARLDAQRALQRAA